ncbi:MAG: hypothetical protein E2O79_10135 [Caldithrix sp.]|nr:MAG: hypothetical protein E2O79_10135 [Caldithrix sp.]
MIAPNISAVNLVYLQISNKNSILSCPSRRASMTVTGWLSYAGFPPARLLQIDLSHGFPLFRGNDDLMVCE